MIPPSIANFYMANQELLWLTTLALDLAFVVLLFRLFGIVNAAKLGVTEYGIKIVISLIDTPFIYWARYIHRSRRETATQPA